MRCLLAERLSMATVPGEQPSWLSASSDSRYAPYRMQQAAEGSVNGNRMVTKAHAFLALQSKLGKRQASRSK